MRSRPVTSLLLALALVFGAAACGSDDTSAPSATTAGPVPVPLPGGEVTVLAAASLTDVFGVIAGEFEAANPGVTVKTSFAASSTLATQIREGAPADVFVSADEATVAALDAEGLLSGEPVVVARNRIAIAVAPDNPLGIAGLADLSRPGVVYVAAGPSVPITRYADQALADAGVSVEPVSQEADVRSVLTKVVSGEADAGIVYATDVAASRGGATGIDVASVGIVATYPAALLRESSRPDLASAFLAFLSETTAQKALADAGFAPPA